MKRSKCAGFSLVEVTIAIALFAVAIMSLQGAILSFRVSNRLNQETNLALNEARRQLENVRNQSYGDLVSGVTSFDVTHDNHSLNRNDPNEPVGSLLISDELATHVRTVRASIAWRGVDSRPRTIVVGKIWTGE